jgi:hypothetical protein
MVTGDWWMVDGRPLFLAGPFPTLYRSYFHFRALPLADLKVHPAFQPGFLRERKKISGRDINLRHFASKIILDPTIASQCRIAARPTKREVSMKNKIMLGLWRYMLNIPSSMLDGQRAKSRDKIMANMAFMTPEHRRVHHYAVRELPFAGKPLEPASIAANLGMTLARVETLLGDLQEHMTFLYRNAAGHVVWAYPVTVEQTPHRVVFNTGESIYAA